MTSSVGGNVLVDFVTGCKSKQWPEGSKTAGLNIDPKLADYICGFIANSDAFTLHEVMWFTANMKTLITEAYIIRKLILQLTEIDIVSQWIWKAVSGTIESVYSDALV